jgi:predicted acylesterase/phospholipase RssA
MVAKLSGIRVHVSGALPDEASPGERATAENFVTALVVAVLREGGAVVHGSHPSLRESIRAAAEPFVNSRGAKDAITLVRAKKYAQTERQRSDISEDEKYSVVQFVPYPPGHPNESLMPLREWMADRSDVTVAVGGRHWSVNRHRAGVPLEIEAALERGHPVFLMTSGGGAAAGYVAQDPLLFGRLRNGLDAEQNAKLSSLTDVRVAAESIVDQIARLPIQGRTQTPRGRFRILSLDGGGIRGVFTAAVLAQWAAMLGQDTAPLGAHFDMIAGTSTGAILAIAVGLGKSPQEILELYRQHGPDIFESQRAWGGWLTPKHKAPALKAALLQTFGTATISDSRSRLVIPSVRARRGRTEVFTTPHHPDRTAFETMKAVDVAMASSAAPTYFDQAPIDGEVATETFLDGGVWANNPIVPALAEALRYVKVPIERVDVLSIGTVEHEIDLASALGKGKVGWAAAAPDLFMASQQHGALSVATKLLGRSGLLRINQTSGEAIPIDGIGDIEDLAQRGAQEARDTFDQVRSRFLDGSSAVSWRSPA